MKISFGYLCGMAYFMAGLYFITSAFSPVFCIVYGVLGMLMLILQNLKNKTKIGEVLANLLSLIWLIPFPVLFSISIFRIENWSMGLLSILVNLGMIVMLFKAANEHMKQETAKG